MPIDPHILQRLALVQGIRTRDELADPEPAARFQAYMADPAPYQVPDLIIEDRAVGGPHGPIPLRVYRRRDLTDPGPGLLWVHGGGFRSGTLDWAEAHVVSAELAARSGAVVVSVDYRLANDGVTYPMPLDDVVAAWHWMVGATAELAADPSRLAIGGASAGGNLAVATCIRLRDAAEPLPVAALLAYPVVHFPVPALADAVVAELGPVPDFLRFFAETNEEMFTNYVGRATDYPGYVTPGHLDLAGLPPTSIVVCEYDDLRPSGELLGRQLEASQIPTTVQLAPGMLHGHLNRTPALPEVDRSLQFFADALTTLSR